MQSKDVVGPLQDSRYSRTEGPYVVGFFDLVAGGLKPPDMLRCQILTAFQWFNGLGLSPIVASIFFSIFPIYKPKP